METAADECLIYLCQAYEKLELTLLDLEVPWMLRMDCRGGCQDGVLEDHAAMKMEICLGGPQEAVDYIV